MKIGVIGLGLIGGSIFKALRGKSEYDLVGVSSSVKEENVCLTLYAKQEQQKILVYILAQAEFASVPLVQNKIRDSFTARVEALFSWLEGQYNEIK